LESEGCCCHPDTETDASDETFSQASDNSEMLGSEEASSADVHRVRHTACTVEMALAGSETLTSKPPETATSVHALRTNGDTCREGASSSLHNPVSSFGTTQQMLEHSSDTVKQNGNRVSTAKKCVNFAPSTWDPRLKSAPYGDHLFKTKTSFTSDICETDSQSTYFSIDPNLQQGSSDQIRSPSHSGFHESSSQMQSTDMCAQNTSDLRQSPTGLNVHSQLCTSKSINMSPRSPICPININENETRDLPDMTCVMRMNTSDIGKKQGKHSKFKMNINSSTQSPADRCSSTSAQNPDELVAYSSDVRKGTKTSQNTIRRKSRHKVESRLKPLSNEGSHTEQNSSKLLVTNAQREQMENMQTLHVPQEFISERQHSEHCALTQGMMTQSEVESLILGIKRIWLHSAGEYVPNCQLPEGFWTNKAAPIPEDLLQALENW
jgi:hypothetical protein